MCYSLQPSAIRALTPSPSKLPQVMVEVFVHPRAPLVRRECAKERMRMFCALRFPALVKLPDTSLQLFPFPAKISRIGDHQFLSVGLFLENDLSLL